MKSLIRGVERHFLAGHLIMAAGAAGAFALWLAVAGGEADFNRLLTGNRGAVYGALASIFGALLGFVIAAIAIVLGYAPTEQFAFIREQGQYHVLWKIFIRSIEALGTATIIALVALVFDTEHSPSGLMQVAVVFATVWAILSLSRVIWAIKKVVALVTKERQ